MAAISGFAVGLQWPISAGEAKLIWRLPLDQITAFTPYGARHRPVIAQL